MSWCKQHTAWNVSKVRNWLRAFEIYGNSIEPTPTDTPPAPTPDPSPTPRPDPSNGVHAGNLDATSVANGSRWNALIIVTVHDALENPLQGVTVSGKWSNGATGIGSCITGVDRTCSIFRNNLKTSVANITFTIAGLAAGFPYQSSANPEPDDDSNGTKIVASQP